MAKHKFALLTGGKAPGSDGLSAPGEPPRWIGKTRKDRDTGGSAMWLMNAYRGPDGNYILVTYPKKYEGREDALYLGVMTSSSLGLDARRGIMRQLVDHPYARITPDQFYGQASVVR